MTSSLPTGPNETPEWLVLIPTRFELQLAEPKLKSFPFAIELCGFGPIVAAARTMQLVQTFCPRRILLLGIAGAYSNRIPLGQCCEFDQVGCYGIGVGEGSDHQSTKQLRWKQLDADVESETIGDRLTLQTSERPDDGAADKVLLTVTTAADSPRDVDNRLKHFPNAMAEDMEAFGVATACHLAKVPLHVVRGISNHAGERDKQHWKISEAIDAAVDRVISILESAP